MTEREIFTAALARGNPADRAAFLNQACGDDASLRQRIESLLAEHQQLGSFMGASSGAAAATLGHGPVEHTGTQIGPYKLLQQIGEGGMGIVYMAEQAHPVERRVALKIIKPGMDTRQVIARFEAERQALAMMDHPNIAKVFDAGTTRGEPGGVSPGSPYFVMELVRGVPITKYCDEHHLTLKQRLELFLPVCQAVQHAHQKGIIHRDLKPTNVLVALYDDKPVPKVIDFGVAKAAQKLTERTMFTEFGQVVGTLEYMSPEQARLNQLDIDTRSDIYSLGVLLYELLTGCTPFDGKRLRSAAFDEMLRIIREEEPPRPSTRLSSADTLPSIAANRNLEPARLGRDLRGELDWIVMKALEKDRNRRYETASGFAADLQHYLNDEPVQACPPSVSYRFRKFARRNRTAVLATAAAAVAVVIGIAGLVVSNVLIARQRNEKAIALDAYKAQLQRTEDALHFAMSDESNIVSWAPFILNDDDEVHAILLPDEEQVFRLRLQTYQGYVGTEADLRTGGLGTAEVLSRKAWLQLALGQLREAETSARLANELLGRLAREEPKVPEYRTELSDCKVYIGEILEKTGRPAEAEPAYREGIRLAEELFNHPERPRLPYAYFTHDDYFCHQVVFANVGLGRLLYRTGQLDAAEVAYRDALVWQKRRPPIYGAYGESTLQIKATCGLAEILSARGKSSEAEEALREACAAWEKMLVNELIRRHATWNIAVARTRLGDCLRLAGREEEAAESFRLAFKHWEDLTAAYPSVPAYTQQLAWFLAAGPLPELRDPARAVTLAQKAVDLAAADGRNWSTLAAAHYRSGNWREAEIALEKARKLRPWGDGFDLFLLSMILWQLGNPVGAREAYDKAVAWMVKNDVHSADMRRLSKEAAELIGGTQKQ